MVVVCGAGRMQSAPTPGMITGGKTGVRLVTGTVTGASPVTMSRAPISSSMLPPVLREVAEARGIARGVPPLLAVLVEPEVDDVELVAARALAGEVGVVGEGHEVAAHEEPNGGEDVAAAGDLHDLPGVGDGEGHGEREGATPARAVAQRVAVADEGDP